MISNRRPRSRQRPAVVFPQPDSPTSPNISPRSIAKLTSSTARTGWRPESQPPRAGNSFTSRRTSRSAISARRRRRVRCRSCSQRQRAAPDGRHALRDRGESNARHGQAPRGTGPAPVPRMAESARGIAGRTRSQAASLRATARFREWREAACRTCHQESTRRGHACRDAPGRRRWPGRSPPPRCGRRTSSPPGRPSRR